MWKKDNVYDELREIAPTIAGIPNVNVYKVSDSYFNTIADNVLAIVGVEENVSFAKTAHPGFSVPEGYFDTLAGSILGKIKSQQIAKTDDELAEIAPTLTTISRANVYTLPVGYFDTFQVVKPAPVVRFTAVKRVYSYAIAAVIFAIMAISAFLLLDKKPASNAQAGISEQNVSAAVSTLSEAEIESYLGDQSIADAAFPAIIIPDSDFDVKEVIEELSEEELQLFLKQNPAPANTPTQDS
jgi:hypothetical protein